MKTFPKEKQVASRLFGIFTSYRAVMETVTVPNQEPDWELLRKHCSNMLDNGFPGIIQDVKKLEEIATRKAEERND